MYKKEVVTFKSGTTLTGFVGAVASNTVAEVVSVHPAYEVETFQLRNSMTAISRSETALTAKPGASVVLMHALPSLIVGERSPIAAKFGLSRGMFQIAVDAELQATHAEWPEELEHMPEAKITSMLRDNVIASVHTNAWVYVGEVQYCYGTTRVTPMGVARGTVTSPVPHPGIPRSVSSAIEMAAEDTDRVCDEMSLITHQIEAGRIVKHGFSIGYEAEAGDARSRPRSIRLQPRQPPRLELSAIYVNGTLYVGPAGPSFESAPGNDIGYGHPMAASSSWVITPASYINLYPLVLRYAPNTPSIELYVRDLSPRRDDGETLAQYLARIEPEVARRVALRDAGTEWSLGSGATDVAASWPIIHDNE